MWVSHFEEIDRIRHTSDLAHFRFGPVGPMSTGIAKIKIRRMYDFQKRLRTCARFREREKIALMLGAKEKHAAI